MLLIQKALINRQLCFSTMQYWLQITSNCWPIIFNGVSCFSEVNIMNNQINNERYCFLFTYLYRLVLFHDSSGSARSGYECTVIINNSELNQIIWSLMAVVTIFRYIYIDPKLYQSRRPLHLTPLTEGYYINYGPLCCVQQSSLTNAWPKLCKHILYSIHTITNKNQGTIITAYIDHGHRTGNQAQQALNWKPNPASMINKAMSSWCRYYSWRLIV